MAALDDDKVMDVSKPGAGRIISTSRPVVAPVSQINVKDADVTEKDSEKEAAEPVVSSQSHKVIQPLAHAEEPDSPAEADDTEKPEKPDAAPAPEPETSGASDAAGVDELAKTAESKKLAAKEAEAQVKKDEELQKLIASKKYVVPIGHASVSAKKKTSLWLTVMALVLGLLVAGYLLVDSGVIKSDIKLPFEVFKEQTAVDTSLAKQADKTQDTDEAETSQDKPAEETPAVTSPGTVTPESRARDTDRKNELKNLQQKLETHFNDNDTYPSSLADLRPALTQDELTGPAGDAYTYSAAADNQTYQLSAVLEDKTDKDADSGTYILKSVNQ